MSQKTNKTLHNLRYVTGCALIGSVLTGVFFAWIPAPFDLRVVSASIGALVGAMTLFHA
jgi:hypothetical protein